jgi:hypothetical protein
MEPSRIAAFTLVVGSILFVIAALPMPAIYGVQDADARIARIHANEPAFLISQALFAIGAVVVAIGFVLLAVWLVGQRGALLPVVGAVAMAIGAALWTWFMYDRATDIDGYFRDYGRVPTYVWISVFATAAGLAAFGLLFIGPSQQSWVGYLTFGIVVITVAGALLAPKVMPPQLLYVPPLVMGTLIAISGPSAVGATA